MRGNLSLVMILICLLALSAIGSCSNEGSRSEPLTFVYECDDDYVFVVRIEGTDAWLFLPGRTVKLSHVPSGSGAKYTDGSVTFWSKGEEALLEVEGEEQRSCRNNRSAAIWEHAKLNGVDFRAIGNEPGWHLEISAGLEKIVFVTDYGESCYEFPFVDPAVDNEVGTAVYRVSYGEHELEVLLEGTSCRDTMSGEEFETAVKVVLDGKEYHGCGRALH